MCKTHQIILFDGVCNLCNSTINFIIDNDPEGLFKFASLQSKLGEELMKINNIDPKIKSSIILIDGSKVYIKSTAILCILKSLSGGYKTLYIFMIVPKFIRDYLYSFFAKNRYNWFGKKNQCRVANSQIKSRFLN